MTDSLWNQSLASFREALGADRPTPSCGAASAVSASLGMALASMALRISDKREPHAGRETLIAQSGHLSEALGRQADADARAFERYLAEQGAKRDMAEPATRGAVAVPLYTAWLCREGLRLTLAALPLCKPSLRCDVEAGALLLHAALGAALLNLDTHLDRLEPLARKRAARVRRTLRRDADAALAALRRARRPLRA